MSVLSIDNKGNNLSAEQQFFFRNSKCKNKKQQLIVCYHGSPNKFNTFENSKIGSTNDYGMYGPGFYFTNKKDVAIDYGSAKGSKVYLYKVYLNITKPFYITGAKSEKVFYDILDKDINTALKKDNINPNQEGLNLAEINTPNYRKQKIKNFNKIKENYDGIIVKYAQHEEGNHSEQYVVFNSSQIKLIKNRMPSEKKSIKENTLN